MIPASARPSSSSRSCSRRRRPGRTLAARELDLEGLVTRRVAGRAPAAQDAVAEDVPAVLEVLQQHPRHARLVEIGLDVGHLVERVGPVSPLVLRASDEDLRVREAVDLRHRAGVIEMQVALDDPADVRGIDPDAAQAGDRRLLGRHGRDGELVDRPQCAATSTATSGALPPSITTVPRGCVTPEPDDRFGVASTPGAGLRGWTSPPLNRYRRTSSITANPPSPASPSRNLYDLVADATRVDFPRADRPISVLRDPNTR